MKHRNRSSYGVEPGAGVREQPDTMVVDEDGQKVAIWFRPENGRKPERYDIGVPHKERRGWMVYFLFLVFVFACIIGLLV